jgi:predicted negative regulator of RcsB-dependent stress response
MLVSWKVWKERNRRAFRNYSSTAATIINKIEEEAMMWSSSSAIAVSNIIPRE